MGIRGAHVVDASAKGLQSHSICCGFFQEGSQFQCELRVHKCILTGFMIHMFDSELRINSA